MAYVALYRAYRPQKFSEVVGQEQIKQTLQNAIKLNKVAHAYLFCGPRGTGKTTMAKIMAKALNCEQGPTIEPCCECDICKGIAKGTIPDVIEIDAASNNGADDIRQLRDTVKYLPAVGKYKVYIIDEVHMLSNAAFNALLKTLEEPPKHVVFILATTEPYKLPNTILSRCQRFDFKAISNEDILKRLRLVAKEEKINVTDDALNQIAISAEGGMRDALSLFDQSISFSVGSEITLEDVLAVSGNISYLKIISLLNACLDKNDNTTAIQLIDSLLKEGKEVPKLINDIILFLRDLLLYKNNAVLTQKPMFNNEEFIKLSKVLQKGVIYSYLDILNSALNQMRYSTQKRAYLELAILKMNDTKLSDDAGLIDRVEALERLVKILSEKGVNISSTDKKEKENTYTPSFPSQSELNSYTDNTYDDAPIMDNSVTENPKEQVTKKISQISVVEDKNTSDEINIEDITNILYNANKQLKNKLISEFNLMKDEYSDFAIQTLLNGEVVASSNTKFIVTLPNVGYSNRVMKYENYLKIMEILKDSGLPFNDYICLPKSIWDAIMNDFCSKRTKENPKPVLSSIITGVKKRVYPSKVETNQKDDTVENKLKDLFGNDLKIVEE